MSQPILEIKHLKKSYGQNEVLKDISLTIHKGEVISIIGSSGSGKSTFLRSINLLETPTEGEILYHGENVLEKGYNLTHYREKLGMVFQSLTSLKISTFLKIRLLHRQLSSNVNDQKQRKLLKKTLKKLAWESATGKLNQNNFLVVKSNV